MPVTAKGFQKGRLTRAVGAYDHVQFPGMKYGSDVVDDTPAAGAAYQVIDLKHKNLLSVAAWMTG